MYAVKQCLVTAEHAAGDGHSQTIFYMDLRSHNKEFERYYQDAKAKGTRFIKTRPHTIEPGPNNIGVKLNYVTESGDVVVEDFDMLVLSVGLEAPKDALALAEKCGLTLDHHNFVKTGSFTPVATGRDGVYVCGAFRSPKAIPRSVTEASAAAAEAARALVEARGTLTHEKTYPPERDISGEELRIGVFVCSCGINIAGVVDVQDLAAYAGSLPGGRCGGKQSLHLLHRYPGTHCPEDQRASISTASSSRPAPPGPTNPCSRTPCGRRV